MAARAFMTNLFRRGKEVLENVLKGTTQKVRVPRRSVVKKTEPVSVQNITQFNSQIRDGALRNIWRGIVPKYHFNGTANRIGRRFPWRPGGSALLLAFNTGLVMANGNEEELSNYVQNYVKNVPDDESLFMKVQQLSLDKFEFGRHIGQGCNAAVYEARLIEDEDMESAVLPAVVEDITEEVEELDVVESDTESVKLLSMSDVQEAPTVFYVEADIELCYDDISDTDSDICIIDMEDVERLEDGENFVCDENELPPEPMLSSELTNIDEIMAELIRNLSSQPLDPQTDQPDNRDEYMSIDSDINSGPKYDLAVKMMFNYGIESNTEAILKSMHREAVPSKLAHTHQQMDMWQNGHKVRKKFLPPHPNIVEMWGLFVDEIPQLPDCMSNYPAALPSRIHPDGIGRNMTMFLVMKKYPTTLSDYLSVVSLSFRERLYLYTQLMEGVAHMTNHEIAHRDMKSDNILLDTGVAGPPQLVISDFGCCLADARNSLCLPYGTDEIDRGGNTALMAPEISTAEPGLFSYLDYRKADLWGTGALAYEIFGCPNPFYGQPNQRGQPNQGRLDSKTYQQNELPPLPDDVPWTVRRLVSAILHRDPSKRPTPRLAADVLHLVLWAPSHWLLPGNHWSMSEIKWWIITMATEVHFAKSSTLQALKTSFLEHYNLNRLIDAFQFLDVVIERDS